MFYTLTGRRGALSAVVAAAVALVAVGLGPAIPRAGAQVAYTANDVNPAYTGGFRPGINLNYLPPWSTEQLGDLAAGNPALGIPGVGARSTRPGLFDSVLDLYGVGLNVGAYDHFRDVGLSELTAIVGFPSDRHRDWPGRYCGEGDKWNALFKGIYEPIWDDGADGTPYNEDNAYAAYLYEVVTAYTDHVRFWEIWNEPGLYKGNDSQVFWGNPDYPGSWWVNDPDPCDYSIHAPIEHFVRTLRISYEVIKTISPDDYVTIAGVGSQSFLDALLRNTDNPGAADPYYGDGGAGIGVGEAGSATAEYPYGAGAYIDVLGFHTYPHLDGSTAFAPDNYFERHSDGAADGIINRRLAGYQQVLYNHGYDGVTYPRKQHIATEINVPRRVYTGAYFGGNAEQVNFIAKALIALKINDVYQMHVYSISDKTDESAAGFEFDLMGLYKKLEGVRPYDQQLNDEGVSYKTAADLIYPTDYDAAATAALAAPAGARAYAFRRGDGTYVYALWAETTEDLSEAASATYSFPAALGLTTLTRHAWDFSSTGATTQISAAGIALDATPIYLVDAAGAAPNEAPTPTLASALDTVGGPFAATLTWDEPVAGVAASDFVVANGAIRSLSGSGAAYTLSVAPDAAGPVSVTLPAGAARDLLGLASEASNRLDVYSTAGGGGGAGGSSDADLELALTASAADVPADTEVTFTVTLRNAGRRRATNVITEFPLARDLSYVSAAWSAGDYSAWTANWVVDTLAPGAVETLDVTVFNLSDSARTAFAQVINAREFDADSTPGNGACCVANEDDEAVFTINGSGPPPQQFADLALSASSPAAALDSTGVVEYVLTVRNDGPDPTADVAVQFVLPAGVSVAGSDIPPGTTLSGNVFDANRLNVGESRTLRLTLRAADPAADLVLIAEVVGSARPDPDSTPGNGAPGEDDRAVLVIDGAPPTGLADLALSLGANATRYSARYPLTLTATLTNEGATAMTDIVVHAPRPAGTIYLRSRPSAGTTYRLPLDLWTVPRLEPGETVRLACDFAIRNNGFPITAFGQVRSANGPDADSAPNNRACCTPVEDDEAALRVESEISRVPPTRGGDGPQLFGGGGDDDLERAAIEAADPTPGLRLLRVAQRPGDARDLTLHFSTTHSTTRAVLVDALGRAVASYDLADAPGVHRQPLDVAALAAGTYVLHVSAGADAEAIRIVIPR